MFTREQVQELIARQSHVVLSISEPAARTWEAELLDNLWALYEDCLQNWALTPPQEFKPFFPLAG